MKIEQKKAIAEELHEKFAKAKVVIVTDYKGMDVAATNQLRRKLREAGIEYRVAKNSLLARASKDTGVEAIIGQFKGPNAIALSYDDPVAPAKVLTDFMKANTKLEIKVGVLNGKALNIDDIKALSALPSREVLLARVLSVMNAVPTSFVRVLAGVPVQFLNVLQAIKEKKEAA
ncbi:MAG: 50S ribosomal protein L10 [Pseudomonadota bacterium]